MSKSKDKIQPLLTYYDDTPIKTNIFQDLLYLPLLNRIKTVLQNDLYIAERSMLIREIRKISLNSFKRSQEYCKQRKQKIEGFLLQLQEQDNVNTKELNTLKNLIFNYIDSRFTESKSEFVEKGYLNRYDIIIQILSQIRDRHSRVAIVHDSRDMTYSNDELKNLEKDLSIFKWSEDSETKEYIQEVGIYDIDEPYLNTNVLIFPYLFNQKQLLNIISIKCEAKFLILNETEQRKLNTTREKFLKSRDTLKTNYALPNHFPENSIFDCFENKEINIDADLKKSLKTKNTISDKDQILDSKEIENTLYKSGKNEILTTPCNQVNLKLEDDDYRFLCTENHTFLIYDYYEKKYEKHNYRKLKNLKTDFKIVLPINYDRKYRFRIADMIMEEQGHNPNTLRLQTKSWKRQLQYILTNGNFFGRFSDYNYILDSTNFDVSNPLPFDKTIFNHSEILSSGEKLNLMVDSKQPFPQADNFGRLIDILNLIKDKGQVSFENLSSIYGIVERQVQYYVSALRWMSLVDSSDDLNVSLSKRSIDLYKKNLSEREKILFMKHIVFTDDIVPYVFLFWLHKNNLPLKSWYEGNNSEYTEDQLYEAISLRFNEIYDIKSISTIKRRVQTIISWLDFFKDKIKLGEHPNREEDFYLEKLESIGISTTQATLRGWLFNSEMIGPGTGDDTADKINKLFSQEPFSENYKDKDKILDSIKIVRNSHHEVPIKIENLIKQKIDSPEKTTRIYQIELLGDIGFFDLISVDKESIKVSYDNMNKVQRGSI